MSTAPQATWRFVVRAYLDAQYEDARQRHASELMNCEARCLREFGAEPLWKEYEQLIQRRIAALGNTPPESAYEVIEESGERVVALVAAQRGNHGSGIPFLTTRFVLSRGATAWKIDEILRPCFGCNPLLFEGRELRSGRRVVGSCFFCSGTGTPPWMQPRGWWIFRRFTPSPEQCRFCHGTGRCKDCATSPERGWTKVYRSEKLADGESSRAEA
ncbi:MAG TPA: hypothetical protein VFB80_13610 [Pirellulaceae bacterium]|nr:hypothetical protein [Pirellulaceae bacterium]